MIRQRILAIALISISSMQIANANIAKDTGRIVAGTAMGAAGYAAIATTLKAGMAFVTWKPMNITNLSPEATRFFALAGGTIGACTTTYGRTLRAQWDVWFWQSSKELIAITMNEYENDTQLVDALQHYYLAYSYPLVAAKRALSGKLSCLNSAASLIEAALEDIDENSIRADELNDWLDEIYTIRAYVAHAAKVVEKDPRLHAMMEAQNRIDQTQAAKSDANAHWADALGRIVAAVILSDTKK